MQKLTKINVANARNFHNNLTKQFMKFLKKTNMKPKVYWRAFQYLIELLIYPINSRLLLPYSVTGSSFNTFESIT